MRETFQSTEQALRFYYVWRPRLDACRSIMPRSAEEFALAVSRTSGAKPTNDDILCMCVTIGMCLDVLSAEERQALDATFGVVVGHERVRMVHGQPVYVDLESEEVVGVGCDVGAGSGARTAGARVPDRTDVVHLRQSGRGNEDGEGTRRKRRPSPLSYENVARSLGWVTPGGAPNKNRVWRLVGVARHRVSQAMIERGLVCRDE